CGVANNGTDFTDQQLVYYYAIDTDMNGEAPRQVFPLARNRAAQRFPNEDTDRSLSDRGMRWCALRARRPMAVRWLSRCTRQCILCVWRNARVTTWSTRTARPTLTKPSAPTAWSQRARQ